MSIIQWWKEVKDRPVSFQLRAFIGLCIECHSHYKLIPYAGIKSGDTLIKNIAWHSLCDAWELNRIILVWKDIAVSLKWLTKQEPGSYIAQYNSALSPRILFLSLFFAHLNRPSECANKILWNQTKFVLVCHNVVKRGAGGLFWGLCIGKGIFWQWGLAGCESVLHLQGSVAFTWNSVEDIQVPRS